MFEENQVREATLEYFGGDELATNVFMTKYCLRDKKGSFTEKKFMWGLWLPFARSRGHCGKCLL